MLISVRIKLLIFYSLRCALLAYCAQLWSVLTYDNDIDNDNYDDNDNDNNMILNYFALKQMAKTYRLGKKQVCWFHSWFHMR